MHTEKQRPVVCVMLGDASGVGAEIVVKAFVSQPSLLDQAKVILLGDERILQRAEALLDMKLKYRKILPDEIRTAQDGLLFSDTGNIAPEEAPFGAVSAVCGKAVVEDIRTAMDYYVKGFIDGICFAPFNKQAMRLCLPEAVSELYLFTDYCLKNGLAVDPDSSEMNVVDGLWTTRVTSHIPMVRLGEYLTYDKILAMIRLAGNSCRAAGIKDPRIAVAALNPHAGEGGLCGDEEQRLILPAIEQAKKEGYHVTGMYPADTVFVHAFAKEADVVVTMYHDQGQIALKLRKFTHAVTVVAGLPLPVGTPAHGTAHDIAGTGKANPSAFITAFGIIVNQAAVS